MCWRLAIAGVVAGVASGALALLFGMAVDALSSLFQAYTLLVWLLPLAGLLTYALYRAFGLPFFTGTRSVLKETANDGHAPLQLAPAIILATCLTIVTGGSVGKEAAALQMAAALSPAIGKLFRLKKARSLRLLALCGMASSLGALLGTPLAAAVFVFELFRPRREHLYAIAVVLVATLATALLTSVASPETLSFDVVVPALTPLLAARMALLVLAGVIVCTLYCGLLELGRTFTQHHLHPAVWLVAGGLVYASVMTLLGCFDVAGTGMAQNTASLSGGMTTPFFALKLLMTVLLLVCGFKGGEIMPMLCIGATLGCHVGYSTGGDAAFLAALGMVLMFAACTDCPLTAVLIGAEAFGIAGLPWYLVMAALGYLLTSHVSLYSNSGRAREWPLLKYRKGRQD